MKRNDRMGHVHIVMKIANYTDMVLADEARLKGRKKLPPVRTLLIPDALVDTGTTHVCLPKRLIKQLGLKAYPGKVSSRTANGVVERKLYKDAFLTLEGRSEIFSVLEVPDDVPPLIGVIPLEALDFIVDPTEQKLVGKHGEKRVLMMY